MSKFNVIVKWIASFLKSDWEINDYPLLYRMQGGNDSDQSGWQVQIVNWWQMCGVGQTKEEALSNLSEGFALVKSERKLPRPGTGLPIEFASSEGLEQNWDIVCQLISEVLGFSPDQVFVSDQSSLWDFTEGEDIASYQGKIEEIFGVDVSDIESGNLVEISKSISDKLSSKA